MSRRDSGRTGVSHSAKDGACRSERMERIDDNEWKSGHVENDSKNADDMSLPSGFPTSDTSHNNGYSTKIGFGGILGGLGAVLASGAAFGFEGVLVASGVVIVGCICIKFFKSRDGR